MAHTEEIERERAKVNPKVDASLWDIFKQLETSNDETTFGWISDIWYHLKPVPDDVLAVPGQTFDQLVTNNPHAKDHLATFEGLIPIAASAGERTLTTVTGLTGIISDDPDFDPEVVRGQIISLVGVPEALADKINPWAAEWSTYFGSDLPQLPLSDEIWADLTTIAVNALPDIALYPEYLAFKECPTILELPDRISSLQLPGPPEKNESDLSVFREIYWSVTIAGGLIQTCATLFQFVMDTAPRDNVIVGEVVVGGGGTVSAGIDYMCTARYKARLSMARDILQTVQDCLEPVT